MQTLNILKSQFEKSMLSHAYLVSGQFDPDQFIRLLKIKTPDLLQIQEVPLKINLVRKIIHWLALKPHSSRYKIAIVYQAETMTLEAANAFLKILEEPPSFAVVFMQTQKLDLILPTIRSRCQIIKGEKAIVEDVPEYEPPEVLSKKSVKEKFDYVGRIAESKNLDTILNLWEKDFQSKLQRGENVQKQIKEIFKTRDLLLTNTSVKLLLENLLLNF